MNAVDLAAIVVVALSAILALSRGFVHEVLSIAAWLVAAWLAREWHEPARQMVVGFVPNADLADPIAYAAVFLVALLVFSMVTGVVGKMVTASALGGLDRSLGALFGLARGAALLVAVYIGAGWVLPSDRWPEPVLQSRLLPAVHDGAEWAVSKIPPSYPRPNVPALPAAREAHSEDLLHATPQGRAVPRP